MKISLAQNFRIALVVLFCVFSLPAKRANSTVAISNPNLEGIQNVAVASSQVDAIQGFSIQDPTRPAMPGAARNAVLPSVAMLAPSPKWSAIFPIIGLIAAVAVTQLLRRRRIAQLRSSSSTGQ